MIIGNGSSVDLMPPEFWQQDLLNIGTNRALCITALQGVRLDAVVIRDCWSCLWKDQKVARRFNWKVWQPADVYKVGPAEMRWTQANEYVRQVKGWRYEEERDHNNEAAVMKNGSVVLMACNVAWHWGVREFVLTGVDYQGRHARMLDGFNVDTGHGDYYDKPAPPMVERQFGEMRAAIEAGGGSIVNVSPGTKLDALEKKTWTHLTTLADIRA